MEMKCNKCQGSGKAPQSLCPVCHGEKIQMKPRDLKFEVEKGMVDGDKVLFKGESEQGFEFFPGDVFVTLRQQSHPYLVRVKNDLKVKVTISLKEAILGFERKIKQLDGRTIDITGDYSTQDNEVIVIEGEGMPIRGEHDKQGDLLAEVTVNFPNAYTDEQVRQIRQIFEAEDSEEL
jgi:DnaJ-class molecular chaperone